VKKSITVLGVETDGIRGVRLEESGADWSCVDQEFWSIGCERNIGNDAYNQDDESGGTEKSNADAISDDDISSDDRYAATVEALKDAVKRFGAKEVVLSMPLSSLLIKVSRTSIDERDHLAETAGEELGKVSPFPDETPVTGIETVAETDRELVTMFAALPESNRRTCATISISHIPLRHTAMFAACSNNLAIPTPLQAKTSPIMQRSKKRRPPFFLPRATERIF
jgi:hypothetical protein